MPQSTRAYERRIGRHGRQLAQGLLAVLAPNPGQSALDVGCGGGALPEPLSRFCGVANVAGADPSAEMLAACRAVLPSVALLQASAEALPLADRGFDVVLAQLVVPLLS